MVLAVLVGSVAALVAVRPASAHDVLRSTDPKNGATLDRTPAAVVLTFDEPAIAMGTRIVVTGPTGPVELGPPKLVDTTVTQPLQGGAPAGSYQVDWRVTSADGHPVSGVFRFTSRAPSPGQSGPGQSSPGQSSPGQSGPGQSGPGQSSPGQSGHGQPSATPPANPAPAVSPASWTWIGIGVGVVVVLAVLTLILTRRRRSTRP